MLLEPCLRSILFLLGLVATLGGCDRQKPETPQGEAAAPIAADEPDEPAPTGRLDRSHAGAPAPAAGFLDPDGEPATLADFRGKPLLVNLWATWCGPCVAEMPTLDALAAREGAIQVLAVSQDTGDSGKVAAFFAKNSFQMLEAYRDPELKLMSEIEVDTLPTTILYDAEGKEVWRMTGIEEWTGARAAGLLKEGGAAS